MRVRLRTAVASRRRSRSARRPRPARPAAPAKAQADPLTVWLMGDAQANWPEAVAAANATFKSSTPARTSTSSTRAGATTRRSSRRRSSAGSGPDVIEFGNTDVPKYSAAGALAPLTRSQFPNSRTWLSGLAAAGSYNGRLYAVPYYAGARAVIYRTDQYRAAGIRSTPKTLAEFNAARRS